jgi:hypothetical protein
MAVVAKFDGESELGVARVAVAVSRSHRRGGLVIKRRWGCPRRACRGLCGESGSRN